jgi:spermidine synthase
VARAADGAAAAEPAAGERVERVKDRWLLATVFVAGAATLGIELTASRLLGSVFGSSNIVWANIIGLMLAYLSAGYFLGGRLADRSPHRRTFYRLVVWAAFSSGVVPLVARPVIRGAAAAVERLNAALMAGSFLAVLLLFSVPVILLGCVSPFAIRLSIQDTQAAGRVSGRIYALSTVGSILGTFLPVLLLIPWLGTTRTFLTWSGALFLVGLVGLRTEDRRQALLFMWMPLALSVGAAIALQGPLKAGSGQIYESESAYNYIQVAEFNGVRYLLLNEGQAVHSVYDPAGGPTFGTWDYFLAAPFFNPPPVGLESVHRLGLVGLAAGTIAKQYTAVFGPIPVDGWEIDPEVVEVGRRFFDMNDPNLNAIAQDGRWGLARSPHRYSVIAVDAYRPPYIPWHMTTREFFEEVRRHLEDDGVVVINVGRTPDDRRLIEAMVGTLRAVYPSVHVVDVPDTFNTIVFATAQPTSARNLEANLEGLRRGQAPGLLLFALTQAAANLQPTPASEVVFTDDWAPVERLADSIVLRFVLSGGFESLR